jgi:tetratricopeptide (TPR) repeat protein/transcriptional regulator with XRE-family HTH domain
MSALPAPTVGFLLKRYRRAAGLTQEALAERAQISVDTISDLERGVNLRPRKDTIDQLADALHLVPTERAHLHAASRGLVAAGAPAPSLRMAGAFAALPPWVGRKQELTRLARHVGGEGPPLLLLAGEPGIGKSRLLSEGVQQAQAAGWSVLEGGCHRRSGQEPYTPLLSALEGSLRQAAPATLRTRLEGCAWLVRLLPELAETRLVPAPSWSLPPEQERRLLFAAVARYLANVAGPAGTLLVLDDLQWAGADALDLLSSLLRTPHEIPLRILGAYRSTEVRPPDPLGVVLADLASAGLTSEYQLRPLARPEASELLTSMLAGEQHPDSALREQILSRTGGVPYFLVSCAEVLRVNGLEGRPAEALPWNVTQSIRQRVAALPQAAQDLLGAAAVVGRETSGTLLLALVGQPQAETVTALEALDRARLLVEGTEATYQFPHDLIREVVLADLSTLRQRHWHRQVAKALEQGPGEAPVEQLSYHYSRAREVEKASLYLERAGDRAQAAYAHAEAESYYRELLAYLEQLGRPLDAARVCEKLEKLLTTTVRPDEALAVLTQAEATYRAAGDSDGQQRVLVQMGGVHAVRGTPSEGLQLLLPVLEAANPGAPPRVLAAMYAVVATLYFSAQRYPESLAAAERALALARMTGEDDLRVSTLHEYRLALIAMERYEDARQAAAELLPLAEHMGNLRDLSAALGDLAWITSRVHGQFAQSRVYQNRGMELSEQVGDPSLLFGHLRRRGHLNFLLGDWQAAYEDGERARAIYPWQDEILTACFPLLILGQVCLAQGKWAEANHWLEEGIAMAERTQNLNGQGNGQATLAERDLLAGQAQVARGRLEPLLAHAELDTADLVALLLPLAWAALLLGEESQAESLVEQAVVQAQQMRSSLPDALRVQALLRLRQRRWGEAQTALENALAWCRAMPYPYAEAKALYVYGLLHQAKGELQLAHERLEAAREILHHLGERLYAEQVEQALATWE